MNCLIDALRFRNTATKSGLKQHELTGSLQAGLWFKPCCTHRLNQGKLSQCCFKHDESTINIVLVLLLVAVVAAVVVTILLQIFHRMCPRKIFENQSLCGEHMDTGLWLTWGHPVYCSKLA